MEQKLNVITANQVRLEVGAQMQEHVHVCFQLYYILHGTPLFIVEDTEIRAHKGSFFYIPPQAPHRMLPLADDYMECLEFKVQVNDPFISLPLKKLSSPVSDTGYILHLLTYIIQNWRSHDERNKENISCLLTTLLMGFFLQELHYEQADSCRISTQNYNQITRSAMAYIEKNYQKPFSLEALSRELNYSKSYISSVFSRYTGISIVDYLNLIRVRHAVLMLAFYSQDVFTTCESVGFSNLSHFSRTFRAMTGASPRSFKTVFSKADRRSMHSLFTDEPILNLQVCTLEAAIASLQSIGATVNAILADKQAE